MKLLTHTDRPVHWCQRVETPALWWWGYFQGTRRTYRLLGIPVWTRLLDKEERPISELIRQAVGNV